AKHASDQGRVWQQVAKKNSALGVSNATGTYRDLAAGEGGAKVVKPYRDTVVAALAKLPEAKSLVGVGAAVNGRVTAVDGFGTPQLFAAYKDALLDSIFVEAADQPATGAAPPTAQAIRGFVGGAEKAPKRKAEENQAGTRYEFESDEVAGSTVAPAAPAA